MSTLLNPAARLVPVGSGPSDGSLTIVNTKSSPQTAAIAGGDLSYIPSVGPMPWETRPGQEASFASAPKPPRVK